MRHEDGFPNTVPPGDDELELYLAGELPPESQSSIDQWIGGEDTQARAIGAFQRTIQSKQGRPSRNPDKALNALRDVSRERNRNSLSRISSRNPSQKNWQRWVGYTALAVAIVVAGIRYLPGSSTPNHSQATNSYSTQPGQRASITLSDGTKVILNVASKLTLARDFNTRERVVHLEGEAQFDVTHDRSKPFIVRANGTQVQDLATVFVVNAYNGSARTQVVVRQGKVSVKPSTLTDAIAVKENQIATVSNNGIPVVKDVTGLENYFGWTDGRLVFKDTPLADALVQLSRWYGLEFRSADSSLLSLDLTGELPAGFDIGKLHSIAGALEADVERSGNVVTFKPKKRQ